jgi:hypothetical protein
MGLIKDEPDSGSEAGVTTSDDQNEEFSMEFEEAEIKVKESDTKVEEADIKFESIYIKEENPEAETFAPIKTEPEVSVLSCVQGSNSSCFLDHLLPQKENI